MINFQEAQLEAEQLNRNLKRDVEVKPINCDCDYSKHCYLCAGEGIFYQLVFTFCGHPVAEDDGCEKCYENLCEEQEKVRSETLSFEHPKLRSLVEAQSEQEERDAA